MASIIREVAVAAPAAFLWEAIRNVGAVHQRLARGFVVDTELRGGERTVTFQGGVAVRERIVTVDEARRRLAYSAVGGARVAPPRELRGAAARRRALPGAVGHRSPAGRGGPALAAMVDRVRSVATADPVRGPPPAPARARDHRRDVRKRGARVGAPREMIRFHGGPMPHLTLQRHLAGVCYARTDRGQELPVLDITHPAFAVEAVREPSEEVADALRREARLFAGLRAPGRAPRVASGLRTYRAKLGDEGLGWARWFPFLRSADAFLAEAIRRRAQSVARLLAAALVAPLSRRPGTPVDLVNVAGGAASDSLNALIVLNRERPFQLMGRTVRVHVLDVDAAGPHFAARALAALRAPGAPLARVDAALDHVPYDWNDPRPLAALLERWRADGGIVAGSSEAGLFEYCTDALVLEHLRLLRDGAPQGFALACTAWRGDDVGEAAAVLRGRDQPLRSRTTASVAALAQRAGWSVEWSEEHNPLHLLFLLRPR